MKQFLLDIDLNFFKLINQQLVHPWLTEFFLYITNIHKQPVFQIGLVLFLIFCFFKNKKAVMRTIAAVVIVAGLSDLIAYRFIKKVVKKPRPHHVMSYTGAKMRLSYGPKSYSFPSNHAMTSFALAHTFRWYFPAFGWFFYLSAALIAYSRVYLGVHFPFDIIAGAGFGMGLAAILREFLLKRIPFFRK